MDSKTPNRNPVLFGTVLFQSISGLAGGIGLVMDPSGSRVQLPVEFLDGSPFSDYLIPGLILLLVLGVYPLIVSVTLWQKRVWAIPAAFTVGVALIVWIVTEIVIIGYISSPPLQLIYGLLGVCIVGLSVDKWWRKR